MGLVKKLGKAIVPFALAGSMFLTGCDSYQPQNQRLEQRRLEQRIARQEYVQNNTRDKYGILFSGNTDSRYRENLSLVYNTLVQEGFDKNNIFVLDYDGHQDDKKYPVDGAATKDNLQKTLEEIRKGLDNQDIFFMYTTDHGGREDGESNISLPNSEELKESELQDYLKGFNPNYGVLVFDQCYSGGFAERLGKGRFIAISAGENELTWSSALPDAFFGAYQNKSESDLNEDGNISVREAFDYSLKNGGRGPWFFRQTPKFVSELDSAENVSLK